METPIGVRTVADRLAFPATDLHVHAWDIGEATAHVISPISMSESTRRRTRRSLA